MKTVNSQYSNIYSLKNIQKFTNVDWKYSRIFWGISKRLKSKFKYFYHFRYNNKKRDVYKRYFAFD